MTNPNPAEVRRPDDLIARFRTVRDRSLGLAAPLSPEDQQVQSMPDVSPTKWHLAHTTWFWETFLLKPYLEGYTSPDGRFDYLFNSYYEAIGSRHPRAERGLISRPSCDEVVAYRRHVDDAMTTLLADPPARHTDEIAGRTEIGLNHEEQHQELLLMDIKHVLSMNPLSPAYARSAPHEVQPTRDPDWVRFDGGLVEIGHDGDGWAFDNEGPRHKVWLEPFALADRLVTVGDWLSFIEDDGYHRAELWLSDGWAVVQAEQWRAPLYWREDGEAWSLFSLTGQHPLNPAEPVCHVSFYEADAFARWSGRRLPTEAEWEVATAAMAADSGPALHPRPAEPTPGLRQMQGEVWQWTASPYVAYPRYRPAEGALGEYNGKFMSNQMVLRGGACVTPPGHARATYRNFYPPAARWPFTGLRLADDV
ncbi:ergothioneine biosynthesis protein EgtB [Brevundimonas lutea]|uniref:ergothioneine biosynthesis protein EgtB n=1 Tax=Brevundimonas lutea TaxID=2293980 RepID=UPI001F0C1E81|nr:ergothioneine biosynthesis protein EgtB [Brevundimonas lutea]